MITKENYILMIFQTVKLRNLPCEELSISRDIKGWNWVSDNRLWANPLPCGCVPCYNASTFTYYHTKAMILNSWNNNIEDTSSLESNPPVTAAVYRTRFLSLVWENLHAQNISSCMSCKSSVSRSTNFNK